MTSHWALTFTVLFNVMAKWKVYYYSIHRRKLRHGWVKHYEYLNLTFPSDSRLYFYLRKGRGCAQWSKCSDQKIKYRLISCCGEVHRSKKGSSSNTKVTYPTHNYSSSSFLWSQLPGFIYSQIIFNKKYQR